MPRTHAPATGAFAEALKAERKVGAANATDPQIMAGFCYDTLQILVGAYSPQLVWEGAQRAGLTTRDLLRLCHDRDLRALDDLQWSEDDEEAVMDAVMREQIASAVPCDECGEIGHTAADHDAEPNPVLAAVLTAALPGCRR